MPSYLNYPSEKDLEKNRLLVIIEGASAKTIFNLTTGAFLVGLLKFMGASDKVCGYILSPYTCCCYSVFITNHSGKCPI